MGKLKLAILRNEVADDHLKWLLACREYEDQIDLRVVDITKSDWLDKVKAEMPEGILASPSGWTTAYKTLYDERISILAHECGIPVFPSIEEIFLFENKKRLSYWLKANDVPHPPTLVFYDQSEALNHLTNCGYPVVAKMSLGASGSGVQILHNSQEAENYIRQIFSGEGLNLFVGPKWKLRGFSGRVMKALMHPRQLKLKLSKYSRLRSEIQKDFVILQEYVAHEYEWRCVRIGDSFFAHKKIKVKDKASGSLVKQYDDPPKDLLDFVKWVTDKRNFLSQAVDILVASDGTYLVNEMQCIFGQSDPYQMLIDGQPGRYRYCNNRWVFEPGDFNRFESYLLRLEYFMETLKHSGALNPVS